MPGGTIATMPPTPLQARDRTRRRAGYAEGLESLRGRVADRSAPSPTGTAPDDISLAAPGAVALRRLASLLARYAPHDGVFPLRLPGVYALRRAGMTSQPVHATLGPSLCIGAQGAKVVMLGSEVLEYDPARMLVFAVDLPVSGQVTRASRRDPFLGFKLDLDPARVAELAARVFPNGVPKPPDNRGLYVGHATDAIIDAVTRLLDLMGRAEDADLLGPLVVDEILIRLLRTPIGTRVAQIGAPKSGVQRVAEAVSFIRTHFAQPVTVEENGRLGPHERIVLPPALQSRDLNEPAPIPESSPAERGPAADAVPKTGRKRRVPARRLPECFAVHQGIRALLRECADQRCRPAP